MAPELASGNQGRNVREPITRPVTFWTALGWLLIGTAGIGLARRRRSCSATGGPRIPERIRRDVVARLTERHSDVAWKGALDGTWTAILEVDGQETLVPLQRFAAQVEAFPEATGALVDRLVDEVRSAALETPDAHEFGEVASEILPQVRRLEWVRAHGGAFGDSALVHRPIGDDLAACYVIDGPESMTFVCRRHLELWGKSAEDVDRLALSNLRRRSGSPSLRPPAGPTPLVVRRGDGYDAARMLLLDPSDADDLLVALPERDVLWMARPDGTDLFGLMARNAAQHAHSARPLSDRLYVVRGGRLVSLSADEA